MLDANAITFFTPEVFPSSHTAAAATAAALVLTGVACRDKHQHSSVQNMPPQPPALRTPAAHAVSGEGAEAGEGGGEGRGGRDALALGDGQAWRQLLDDCSAQEAAGQVLLQPTWGRRGELECIPVL